MTAVIRKIGEFGFNRKEDSQIWEEFKEGSDEALVYIYKQHYQALFKYGFKVCRNKELTKDCIQDIFTELWDNREKINPVQHIKAYLFKYFRRHLLDKVLLERKNLDFNDEGMAASEAVIPFETILINEQASSEMKERVERAFRKLSIRQREVMYLRFYSDLPYEQIADIMDLRYQSVRNLLYESMKVLRKDTTLSLPLLLSLLMT